MSELVQPPEAPVRSARAERTRSRILDAAGHAFAAGGYARTTVEQIATGAGVSKALLYHHFRGKEEILEAVLERTLADWDLAVQLEHDLAETDSVLESISRSIKRAVRYAQDRPMVRALFQLDPALLLDIARSGVVRESMERDHARFLQAVQRGIETGELRASLDPERTATTIQMLQMSLIDHLLNPEWIEVDEALVRQSLDIVLHGMARNPR